MEKIVIVKDSNGDSRTAKSIPSKGQFSRANMSHKFDVYRVMYAIADEIIKRGEIHDYTKVNEDADLFYHDLCETMKGNMIFEDGEWAKLHYSAERHHLLRNVPDDVNLIDVIEMIADCVCAGMARSGEVRPLEIDEKILTDAMNNTVNMIKDSIIPVKVEDYDVVVKSEEEGEPNDNN